MTKIVIVGGVAGGASAAARARRVSEQAQIIMLERGEYISFANCGLPYHIGGTIPERQSLLLQTPESFKRRFNVEVRVRHEVMSIDREAKQLTVRNLQTGDTYQESYDKLLLSPGASPIRPPIPGFDNPKVLTLRNVPDMDKIIAALTTLSRQHVTVVGGGFIGLEVAEALRERQIPVTLLELAPQVMTSLDEDMAGFLHQELVNHGIDLRLRTGLSAVKEQGDSLLLQLSDGQRLETDLVIAAIGVSPDTQLARQAGLELGARGGIQVSDTMQTSDPDIYAVGDAVETRHLVTGQAGLIPLAGPANRQGRMAADNMLGHSEQYRGTQGTAICKIFTLAAASTGLSERLARNNGFNIEAVHVHTGSHAGYYPGAHPVSLKLIYEVPSGRLLGAQAVGRDGIDKRIDVLAVALRAGMSVYDLQHLELTYAPPFGSAKDAINQAAFVATNQLKGDVPVCHPADILNPTAEQFLLDVRNPAELTNIGAIPGAMNIPVDDLRQRLHELPQDKEILVICQSGLRGTVACRILQHHGLRCRNLSGGYIQFAAATRRF
ncbi:FAD-dependent oxidoreductase [Plesiomonas shigelloides]|uniref:FAD-dependent oxidoreductase n=1 Tax=Plesiomonas shigelloides TaxID=703 RepID=A0A8I1W338_PLESH|nr:FAD-dependent oxidoreductase [Plesiomonas shigelloides]MBO1107024.1 FAD-dependent oxidoreductase [Plesiomonas shigelloides]